MYKCFASFGLACSITLANRTKISHSRSRFCNCTHVHLPRSNGCLEKYSRLFAPIWFPIRFDGPVRRKGTVYQMMPQYFHMTFDLFDREMQTELRGENNDHVGIISFVRYHPLPGFNRIKISKRNWNSPARRRIIISDTRSSDIELDPRPPMYTRLSTTFQQKHQEEKTTNRF